MNTWIHTNSSINNYLLIFRHPEIFWSRSTIGPRSKRTSRVKYCKVLVILYNIFSRPLKCIYQGTTHVLFLTMFWKEPIWPTQRKRSIPIFIIVINVHSSCCAWFGTKGRCIICYSRLGFRTDGIYVPFI